MYFCQLFPSCECSGPLADLLSNTVVRRANIDVENRYIFAELYSPIYIPQRALHDLQISLMQEYELHDIDFDVHYPPDQLSRVDPQELRDLFVQRDSMARGSLAGASWQWEGSCLTIQLKGNGKDALLKNAPKVADELSKRFATDVTIDIVPGENLEGPALFDAMEKLRSQMLEVTPTVSAVSKPAAVAPVMSSDTIFGKPFKGTVTPM